MMHSWDLGGRQAVEDWGTYGERLAWTLLRFPENVLGGPRVGDPRPVA